MSVRAGTRACFHGDMFCLMDCETMKSLEDVELEQEMMADAV